MPSVRQRSPPRAAGLSSFLPREAQAPPAQRQPRGCATSNKRSDATANSAQSNSAIVCEKDAAQCAAPLLSSPVDPCGKREGLVSFTLPETVFTTPIFYIFFPVFFVKKNFLLQLDKGREQSKIRLGFFDTLRSMCVAVKLLRDDRCCMHHQSLRRRADCCSSFCSDGLGWVGGLAGEVVAVGAQNTAGLHLNPCAETEQQEEKVARRSN
jgi:hypothetical protein